MKTIRLAGQEIIRAALIASMLLGGLPSVGAQQKSSAEEQKNAKAKASGGQQEGIKVHGHWTIEIRNPNGSLVSHFEFENAMADNGVLLTELLNGSITVSKWRIRMDGTPGVSNAPCSGNTGCILDATQGFAPAGPGGQRIFQLQGTITANQAGRIEQVTSQWVNTPLGTGGNFTAKTLDPVDQKAIVNGQIIQVTVQISFS
jgi:hypothetical protein